MWTRRDLLRAAGAGATLAAVGSLACAGGGRATVEAPAYDPDRLRAALRAAVDRAGERLTAPRAFASIHRRVRTLSDLDRRELVVEEHMIAIVGGQARDGRWVERGTTELSPEAIGLTAAELAAIGEGAPATVAAARTPRDHVSVARDPRDVSHRVWLHETDELAARLAARASSRIVYRAAWMTSDDEETWVVGADVDHRQRLVRGRAGAAMVTWHGHRPAAAEATAAVRSVPSAALVTDEALARAAADALTLFTPGGAPSGPATVVLAPELVAALVDRLLALPAVAAAVTPAPVLAIVDDPTSPDAFAGHAIDDDGRPARPTTITTAGAPLAGLAGTSARRAGPRWHRRRGATHLDIAAGPATAAALEAAAVTGVVLEGLRDLRLDDDGRLVIRAARGRELGRGQRTGRVWGDLELRADVGELCAAATGVSQERAAVVFDDDGPPRGALAPWLVTRGELGGGAAGGA